MLVLALISSLGVLASCGGSSSSSETLNIVCLNLGYGREWIDEAVAIWEAANPGYEVDLTASEDASSIIASDIYKSSNPDDLYICNGTAWKTYAGAGKLLDISDILEEEVDGVKIADKINDEYKNSVYFPDSSGVNHTYRLPWTSGIGGIMYNATLFEEQGWEVPTTYDELVSLCDTIVNAGIASDPSDPTSNPVYPFSFTGANSDYFDYTVFSWWGQISGVEAITEFKKYSSSSQFDATSNETYAGLKTAVDMWYGLFGPSKANVYYDGEDIARDNHTAQKNFMNGKAAMMFNGDWVYNEMLNYTTSGTLPTTFSMKIMDTPKHSSATHEAGYIIGEDQYIAVPASTTKAELAKSFIKTLVSDEVINIFANKAHGLLAYKHTGTMDVGDDVYMNSLIDYRNSLDETFTDYSSSSVYLNGYCTFYGATSKRPFQSLYRGTYASVDAAFEDIYNTVVAQWGTWTAA